MLQLHNDGRGTRPACPHFSGQRGRAGRATLPLIVLIMALGGFAADTRVRMTGKTDKPAVSYACGETATVTFGYVRATNELTAVWRVEGDFGLRQSGTGNVVTVSLAKPGFAFVFAEVPGSPDKLRYSASVGFDTDKVVTTAKRPDDFAAFWKARRDEIAAFDQKPAIEEIASPTEGVKLYRVKLMLPAPAEYATGFLSVPTAEGKYPAEATFFGSNGSWATDTRTAPKKCPKDKILFRVMSHAFELDRDKAYYAEAEKRCRWGGKAIGFDPKTNEKPETAYFVGMAMRDAAAMEYLKTRPEWDGKNLIASGFSQGGLQTAWMGALVPGVSELDVQSPWLCDMGAYLAGRVKSREDQDYGQKALAYVDPCFMATLYPKTLKVNVSRQGLGDVWCPPSGVMAYYNAVPGPKRIDWWQGATHSGNPYGGAHQVLKQDWTGK